MSGFGGLCQWDGQPVLTDRLSELSAHLQVAGPDGGGTVQPTPWLALQAHILHFDRLSASERQPHRFAKGSVLTWNGRLDNREDLILSLHGQLQGDESDAAIVAAAYERWGLDALPRFLGDWCLAIWDCQQLRVILARDYMGIRTLYYRLEPARLAWATRLEALAACEHLFSEPNDEFIAGYLSKVGNPDDVSPFRGVSTLPGGHVLVATATGSTLGRYWQYSPATLHYSRFEQYAEHLRTLLTEAVRVRLRSTQTVWAHLSGGWDSSSVVCIADRLIRRRCVDAPNIQPVSLVYDDPEGANERNYMAAVERWCGLDTIVVKYRGRPMFADMLGARVPIHDQEVFGLETATQDSGNRIVLTGSMGDVLTGRHGGPLYALWEPFHAGHPIVGVRNFRAHAKATRSSVAPLLLKAIWQRYGAGLEYGDSGAPFQRWAWLRRRSGRGYDGVTPELLARALARPHVAKPSAAAFPHRVRPLVNGLYHWGDGGRSATPEWMVPVIWRTHAYLHRPLIEFLLAVPSDALFDPVFARAGMKRALIDVLPPTILDRGRKVGLLVTSLDRVRRREHEFVRDVPPLTDAVTDWYVVRRGVVEPKKLSGDIKIVLVGGKLSTFLYRCLSVEAWLRSLAGSGLGVAAGARTVPTLSETRSAPAPRLAAR